MIKKGIILSGGSGTRLRPLTVSVNKQLLPIYDKPMIFYSLSVLMLAGIREILFIVNQEDINLYKKIFNYGEDLGLEIKYQIQNKPNGLPEAFILGADFIKQDNVAMILGDNFFYGYSFSEILKKSFNLKNGCTIFLHKVSNPSLYGVAEFKKKKIFNIFEKPKKTKSDYAIVGLYFFDNNVVKYSKSLIKSKRNEYEIIDLINKYLKLGKLNYNILGRGFTWLDSGKPEDLFKASEFVSLIEKRQGFKIGCIEEIAYNKGWIKKNQILKRINFYGKNEYSEYLKKIIS